MKNRILKFIIRVSVMLGIGLVAIWLGIVRPIFVSQDSSFSDSIVDSKVLKQHVIFLSETSLPRNSKSPNNLAKIADYIKDKLDESSHNVTLQSYSVRNSEYKNVIAEYGPESAEILVIGAHYDAYSTHPGADDNASGVAGLIELGNLLKSSKLKNRVMLVAYCLEEPPYFSTENMGSAMHVSLLRSQNVKIKIMIALEMIGYFSDEKDSQSYPIPMLAMFYPSKGNFIAVIDQLMANNAIGVKSAINKYTDLPAYSINAPAYIPGIDFSDHRNYWSVGYPAVMVTNTAFYRNSAYHTAEDTYDRLDYNRMAKVVFGIFKYIEEIACCQRQ